MHLDHERCLSDASISANMFEAILSCFGELTLDAEGSRKLYETFGLPRASLGYKV